MITFAEARQIVLQNTRDFGTETLPLQQAMGRVLREEWHSDRELPPYNRVAMDGIGVFYEGAIKQSDLRITGVAAAGDPQHTLEDQTACMEVMTGAVLPVGCDTVIRYEDLDIKDGIARITVPYEKGQNIHAQGIDRQAGELLLSPGVVLSASEIGVGASIGQHQVKVAKLPRTMIISTGNELVEIDETPAPHQIRRGNVYRLEASLRHLGLEVDTAHLLDDEDEIRTKVATYLQDYDVIILSGGVSKGKFDFLPSVLDSLGVEKLFHRIAQRPGKPFWFGRHAAHDTTVFALPGNPVSSFMCTQVYLMDWLRTSLGTPIASRPHAILQADVAFKPDLTYFLEVALSYNEQGQILAQPKKGHGSGDLANLLRGDAFICLPRGKDHFVAGEIYPLYFYR
ncbi:MAG: molybdopterin molybdotransferase MoeA [Bacteroidota bacterium]